MVKSSVLKVRVTARASKALKFYSKKHNVSMGEFLEYVLDRVDMEPAFEDASDALLFERRNKDEPTTPFEELIKSLPIKKKLKK